MRMGFPSMLLVCLRDRLCLSAAAAARLHPHLGEIERRKRDLRNPTGRWPAERERCGRDNRWEKARGGR